MVDIFLNFSRLMVEYSNEFIISIVVLFFVIYLAAFLHRKRQRCTAWVEGYQWCIRIHQITGRKVPEAPKKIPGTREDSWRDGYLTCLDENDLPVDDIDRDELHNNPYTAKDASQRVADATRAAGQNVADSIRFSHRRR